MYRKQNIGNHSEKDVLAITFVHFVKLQYPAVLTSISLPSIDLERHALERFREHAIHVVLVGFPPRGIYSPILPLGSEEWGKVVSAQRNKKVLSSTYQMCFRPAFAGSHIYLFSSSLNEF
jgi:hypothetical protein